MKTPRAGVDDERAATSQATPRSANPGGRQSINTRRNTTAADTLRGSRLEGERQQPDVRDHAKRDLGCDERRRRVSFDLV